MKNKKLTISIVEKFVGLFLSVGESNESNAFNHFRQRLDNSDSEVKKFFVLISEDYSKVWAHSMTLCYRTTFDKGKSSP